jgi:hypothetical protein
MTRISNRGSVLGVLLLLSCLYEGLTSAILQAQPLLQQADLVYQGAFKLPSGTFGASNFDRGGQALAYNPANNSLFILGNSTGTVGEISIPNPVDSTSLSALPTATVLQDLVKATEGVCTNFGCAGSLTGGLLVHNGKLIITKYGYYDATNLQVTSHFTRPLNLSTGQVTGAHQIQAQTPAGSKTLMKAGFFSGYMTPIPQAWQSALGGPAITGNGPLGIISRTSYGPAAFAFDPANLGVIDPVPATPLVYYPQDHQTLGWGTNPSPYGTTEIHGIVFPDNSSTVLYFGRQGRGPACYGPGTPNPKLAGQPSGIDVWCYDPVYGAKGTHSYPYSYHVWAYNAADLASAKAGNIKPWQVVPYATWTLTPPFQHNSGLLGGAAYDPATQRIFLSQSFGNGTFPVIHVYQVNVGNPPPPAPPPPPASLPTAPQNAAPKVNAGLDQVLTLPASAILNGLVTDDGLPNHKLSVRWSKVSGPGTVTFIDSTSAKTTATFPVAGSYVLNLSVSDGAATANDNISILVNPASTPAVTDIDIDIESNKKIRVDRCETDNCVERIRVRKNTRIKINGIKQ